MTTHPVPSHWSYFSLSPHKAEGRLTLTSHWGAAIATDTAHPGSIKPRVRCWAWLFPQHTPSHYDLHPPGPETLSPTVCVCWGDQEVWLL